MDRISRSLERAALSFVALAVVVAASASDAGAQGSGIQLTPDSQRYLISKDIGDERWAISFNLADRTVTGNVFRTDGSPPSFVWCEITDIQTADDPADTQYTLDCMGADACESAPCAASDWTTIATGVPLSGSFLLPDGTASTLSGNVQPGFTQSCATTVACHQGDAAGGGVNLEDGATYSRVFMVTAGQDPDRALAAPFDPDNSYLVAKMEGSGFGSQMPLGGMPLPDLTADLRRWIEEGAADN